MPSAQQKNHKAYQQYLDKYAEPEIALLEHLTIPQHKHVLILPAYDESDQFLKRLQPLLEQNNCLVILVVNQPDTLEARSYANTQLVKSIQNNFQAVDQYQNLSLFNIADSGSHILLVDRYSEGMAIPAKQGVGLARKIAADIAVALIAKDTVGQELIHCSDCDAHLPDAYFDITASASQSAIIYPFTHRTDNDDVGKATQLYEFSLNYYQQGLAWASSPYAFHTLGSTLAVRANHYCQVRGFPKRNGGEDFYLLNKLAKCGEVVELKKPAIILEARNSHRVPFGTGPAVEKIAAMENPEAEYTVYNPQCFIELKQLVIATADLAKSQGQQLKNLSDISSEALTAMQIDNAIAHAQRQSKTPEMFLQHFHTWFDAFRTLKFIHQLRDNGLQNISIEKAKQQAAWLKSSATS